jgi:hypothetical protein
MANILDQYGIKEVADVTLYDLSTELPVLFLDTLKVSTIEQTADQSEARGGKGNSPLIIWDYGKEITVTLEDALFTPKSMHIMFGDGTETLAAATATITRMVYTADIVAYTSAVPTTGNVPTLKYYDASDMAALTTAPASGACYVEETYADVKNTYTIEISSNSFPGTYKLVGDTYARNKATGSDEYFQFIIPQAKMGAENTITLEAEGDPTVFNMTMRVLRPQDGVMMKLVKYTL